MATHEVLPLQSMPIGYGFRPTDEEIMNDYLKPKITGKIKADSAIIPELNICEYEACDLPEKSIIDSLKSRQPVWFFFAQKVPKYPNSERSKRATVNGYWKATGKDRSIKTHGPSPMEIGKKKTLVFHRGKAPGGENTGWKIHEYRTVEPEFDQAGIVLCRLFEKPGKGILISNGEKIDDCNIITPNKPEPSKDTTVQGDDALHEITPQLQKIVPPNLPETVDESMTISEETLSYSDISADIGPSEEIAELLASFLAPVEEYLPEFNEFLGNTTESGPSTQVCPTKPETFWDNISGVGSIIRDNANVEVQLPQLQEAPALAASYQMSVPKSPSSYLLHRTPNLYEFDTLSVDGHYPQNSTANKLQSMNYLNENDIFEGSGALETIFRASDLSQDQFKNEPNPSGADNSTRIGVEFRRPPKKRTSANLNQLGSQGLAADGKTPRIRLQSSLRIGSTVITNRHSTRSNKDHDEKAEISEVSGNNAEVEMPKMAYLGPSDNDVLSSSNNSQTKEPNELCVELESTLNKAPKTASINFGRVTVVLSVILCVLCIGICWFCSYR